MKISKNTPAFLRYFSARFKPFTNPLFWGSLGGVFIGGLAIYQYWQHPDWLQTNSETPTNSVTLSQEKVPDVSSEDLAAAADLDNIDVLIKELEQNQTLSAIAAEGNNESSELKREESEFSRFQKTQKDRLKKGKSSSYGGSNPYSVGVDSGNKKLMELLKPPSFSSYESSRNSQDTSFKGFQSAQTEIIPDPVGNIYLSNRDQTPKATPVVPTPPTPPTTPNAEIATPGAIESNNSNLATGNNVPINGETVSIPNGQNSQINNAQPARVNVGSPNRFTSAPSGIQSQQTIPTSINNSAIPSSPTGFNGVNSYSATSNQTNSLGGNSLNNINPNSVNGISGNPNITGAISQPFQNSSIPSLTNGANGIGEENSVGIRPGDNPNILQNNYRSSRSPAPNYTVPNGYQLEPQKYQQNVNSGSNSLNNAGFGGNNLSQQTNNPPANRNGITPSLQPSGVLSTSEVGR